MKEANSYLEMTSTELHINLISDVLENPDQGKRMIENILQSERYQEDHEFRLIVDTARGILLNIYGEFDAVLILANDMIERATSYKMWKQLSIALNIKGNTFLSLAIYERAVEAYLMVIENEKRHRLIEMSSVAYQNLSIIYSRLNDHEKALKYISLSLKHHEKGGKDQPRYKEKRGLYLSNYVMELVECNKTKGIKEIMDEIDELKGDGSHYIADYSYAFLGISYSFFQKDYEEARRNYLKAKQLDDKKGYVRGLGLLIGFIELCEKSGLGYDYYIDEMIAIEEESFIENHFAGHLFYDKIRQYYKSIGDEKKYIKFTEKYSESLKLLLKSGEKQQLISLGIVEKMVKKGFDAEVISKKNDELEKMTKKAIKHKNELEKAYQRIELINELGRKITATTDLEQVVNLIYKNLKESIPLEYFIIALYDPKKNSLTTIINMAFDELDAEESISLDNENSIFVYCFKNSKTVVSSDAVYKKIVKRQHPAGKEPSAIFVPLVVNGKTIGACSVQYAGSNVYTKYHLKFLEQVSPYLSIALNNAIRSQTLEKEIKSRLAAQKKLEILNDSLQKMSSIDGLTKISQRRVFDVKIMEFLESAQNNRSSAAIMMMDIDYFKKYNDTFGHLEGDEVLKRVAQIFERILDSTSGLSARFGGEEFIGAVASLSFEESLQLAEKIREEIYSEKIEHPKSDVGFLTVSIGVAISHNVRPNLKSDLMKAADESLYKAKNSGRNKVIITEI